MAFFNVSSSPHAESKTLAQVYIIIITTIIQIKEFIQLIKLTAMLDVHSKFTLPIQRLPKVFVLLQFTIQYVELINHHEILIAINHVIACITDFLPVLVFSSSPFAVIIL